MRNQAGMNRRLLSRTVPERARCACVACERARYVHFGTQQTASLKDARYLGTKICGSGYLIATNARSLRMDWNRVEGNWKQMKGKVKEQWGKLTEDDLDVIAGKQDQLEGRLQERYGYAKDQAQKEVNDWYDRQTW
jgi:uncharacterized protein YjbJ (UPF0337 family)